MIIKEKVYRGRANKLDLDLTWRRPDGAVPDQPTITKMELGLQDTGWKVSSDIPGIFTWDVAPDSETIHLTISLGGVPNLPVGAHSFTLVVYDPTNPDGTVWGLIVLEVV